jgi:hypothetical protein
MTHSALNGFFVARDEIQRAETSNRRKAFHCAEGAIARTLGACTAAFRAGGSRRGLDEPFGFEFDELYARTSGSD